MIIWVWRRFGHLHATPPISCRAQTACMMCLRPPPPPRRSKPTRLCVCLKEIVGGLVTRPFVPAELPFLCLRLVIVPLMSAASLVENLSCLAALACLPLGRMGSSLLVQACRLKKVKKKPNAPRCVSALVVENMVMSAAPMMMMAEAPSPALSSVLALRRKWETCRELTRWFRHGPGDTWSTHHSSGGSGPFFAPAEGSRWSSLPHASTEET